MEERQYVPQICISASDPVNSVKSLQGNVIGILFEKEGKEIRESISRRVGLIEGKIGEYSSMCERTESFIEKKEKELKELKEFHQEKMDEKKGFLLPLQKEIEKIVKEANDRAFDFDLRIFEVTKEKAIRFEEGFDGIKKDFEILDDLLLKDRAFIGGVTGIQGSTGVIGISGGMEQPKREMLDYANGNVGLGVNDPKSSLDISTDPGSRAYTRLETLQNLLRKYIYKLKSLKDGRNRLKEEKRRLKLTHDHITKERAYKLDLNMLSAFGFENCIE